MLTIRVHLSGGLLVVPVLQPSTDNIPFGLAFSWQRHSARSGTPTSHDSEPQDDLYELQYVLDGEGEVSGFLELLARQHLTCTFVRFLYFGMLLQLCAKSGVLQSVTAGDSILAPVGKAWCQLGAKTGVSSDLAVLKLLVPGSLPSESDNQQQDIITLYMHRSCPSLML